MYGEGDFDDLEGDELTGVQEEEERTEDVDALNSESAVYEIFANNIQSSVMFDTARSLQINFELMRENRKEILEYVAKAFYRARFGAFRYNVSVGVILYSPKLRQYRYFYGANNSRLSLFGIVKNNTEIEYELVSVYERMSDDFVLPEEIIHKVSTEHSLGSDWVLWKLTNVNIRMMYL